MQQLSRRDNSSSYSSLPELCQSFISFQLCKCTVCFSLHAVSNSEEIQPLSYNQLLLCDKRLPAQTICLRQSHHLNQPRSQRSSDVLPNTSHPHIPSVLSVTPSIPLMALSLPCLSPIFTLSPCLFHNLSLLSRGQAVSPPVRDCLRQVSATISAATLRREAVSLPLGSVETITPDRSQGQQSCQAKLQTPSPPPIWTIRITVGGVNGGCCAAQTVADTLLHTVHFHLSYLC